MNAHRNCENEILLIFRPLLQRQARRYTDKYNSPDGKSKGGRAKKREHKSVCPPYTLNRNSMMSPSLTT